MTARICSNVFRHLAQERERPQPKSPRGSVTAQGRAQRLPQAPPHHRPPPTRARGNNHRRTAPTSVARPGVHARASLTTFGSLRLSPCKTSAADISSASACCVTSPRSIPDRPVHPPPLPPHRLASRTPGSGDQRLTRGRCRSGCHGREDSMMSFNSARSPARMIRSAATRHDQAARQTIASKDIMLIYWLPS